MIYTYEILPRPADLGAGWKLRLLQEGEEVGGGVFPAPKGYPQDGMAWWNGLGEVERADWMKRAGFASASEAYNAYLVEQAYAEAERTAQEWLSSRGV